MTLYLDLNAFSQSADRDLLQRVPRRLASYYLALPLGQEGGRVTVVTAHPENTAALFVLRRLLKADIVPVASSEASVREAIARTYAAESPVSPTIVAWVDDPDWRLAVQATAEAFGQAMGQPVTTIDGELPATAQALVADGAECSLLVTKAPTDADRIAALRRSPAPVLLVRGMPSPIRRILIVLRGYGSDHLAVRSVLPFLAHEGAAATVMPLNTSNRASVDDRLVGATSYRAHLEGCLQELSQADVAVSLKLRQGAPADQLIAELSDCTYDMMVIAAEARGDFVLDLLASMDRTGVMPTQPILIVKPPFDPVASLD